jgi:HEPN domain-containing protein
MNSILSHLPEEKQAELKAIVGAVIPRFGEIEMIILFGSYARGNWVEDTYTEKGITYHYKSDYDLLIILAKNSQANHEQLTDTITGCIDALNLPTPVTPIYHSIEFVNNAINEGNYFFNEIRDQGKVLFTTSRYQLALKRELSAAETKARAEKDFKNWFESANGFLKQYEFAAKENDLKIAAFLLHQAVERYYNTVELVFTGYKSKTHNIEILSKIATSCDIRFGRVFPRVSPVEKARFKLLQKAYKEARYDMDYKISREDLDYLSERVELLKKLTADICQEKINSFAGA